MREEVLAFINATIKTETPMGEIPAVLCEEDLLKESGLDSLGYFCFWVEITDKYDLDEKYSNGVDYDHYSIKELIDVCTSNIPRAT